MEDTVVTEGSHMRIQVGVVRIKGKEEGVVVHVEERMGCFGERGET